MQLKSSDLKQIFKFGTVGVVGFVVNYLVLVLVSNEISNYLLSETLAAVVALQVTFLLHESWTYKVEHSERGLVLSYPVRYGTYLISNSTGMIMTIVIYSLLSAYFGRLLSLALAAGISMFWNFFMNRIFIWRRKKIQID